MYRRESWRNTARQDGSRKRGTCPDANARDYTKINSPINSEGVAVRAGAIKRH